MTSQITIVNPTLNVMDIHNMLFEHPLHVLFPFPNCYPKLSARKCRWPQFASSRQDCHVIASCKIIVTSWHKQPLRYVLFLFQTTSSIMSFSFFTIETVTWTGSWRYFYKLYLVIPFFYHKMFVQNTIRPWPRAPLWKLIWDGKSERTFLHIWKNVLWLHILYWEWEEDAFPEICQKFLRYRDSSRGLRENRRTMNSGITIPEKMVLNR